MGAPPVYKKAPSPPPAPPSTWSWWIEGGAFNTGGASLGIPTFKPNWGGEGAVGFDWQAQPLWHVLGQFRYGTASKNKPLNFSNASAGGTTVTVNGTQNLREDHWLTSALGAISVLAMVMPCGPSVCASPICARN
jgi:hypothetical protein